MNIRPISTLPGRNLLYSPIVGTRSRKKKRTAEIFASIRKPTAPPTHRFGKERPEEKAHPAGRKAKHRKPADRDETNGDLS